MTSDKRVESAKIVVQWLLPQVKLPGLQLEQVGFDYLRQSFTVALSRNGQGVILTVPTERIDAVKQSAPFSVRYLKKQIHAAFGVE